MKLRSLEVKNLGALKNVKLDLASCEGVVAIAGDNGGGKSTLMGAMGPGVLMREIPCHDPSTLSAECLAATFTYNDSFYEVVLEAPAKGRAKARIKRDGQEVKAASGTVSAYDAVIASIIKMPRSLLYATYFSVQDKAGAFYKLNRAERRRMFRDMLGLDDLQVVSDEAKRRLAEQAEAVARIEWCNREIEKAVISRSDVAAGLADAKKTASVAERGVEEAQAEYDRIAVLRVNAAVVEELAEAAAEVDEIERLIQDKDPPDYEFATACERLEGVVSEKREVVAVAREADRDADLLTDQLARADEDAKALKTVPCGGEGKFAGCRFLCRATEAVCQLPGVRGELRERLKACAQLDAFEGALAEAESLLAESRYEAAYSIELDRSKAALEAAQERVRRLQKKLPADAGTDLPSVTESQAAERFLRDARRELDHVAGIAVRLEARLEAMDSHIESLKAELATAKDAARDCEALGLIQRAFATDGIQAHEIEAARPRIEELANQLIGSCYDGRFRIELRTQREKKTGGKAEDFDLVVFDNDRDGYTTLRGLSGGEKTVVGEAFAVAISIFNAERNGGGLQTLWRDERTDALDSDNAARYVEMLRAAQALGGFSHIFFSTHIGHCIDAADRVIRVADGTARIG